MRTARAEQASNLALRLGSPLGALLIWEILVRLNVLDARFFPAPSHVFQVLQKLMLSGELGLHLGASLQRVLLGFLLGAAIGLVLGLIIGWSRLAENLIDPLLAVLHPIPKLALLPLVLILFGIGETSKVVIVAIAVFFQVAINTAAGVRMIDGVLIDAARNFGASGARMFREVIIPASMPSIFTGLRLGLGTALIVIVAAEFVASNEGLGYLVWLSWQTLSIGPMYAGLVVIGLLGMASTYGLKWIARILMPWAEESRTMTKRTAAREGRVRRLFQALKRLPAVLFSYSHQYLYMVPKDVSVQPLSEPQGDVRYVWVDRENVSAIASWKGRWMARRFHSLLNRGMLGIYALFDGRVIGYAWGAMRTRRFDPSCMQDPIDMGEAFTGTAEVDPQYRRRGVASRLRYHLLQRIREVGPALGVERIYGAVLVQNTPMQKLIERQGSKRAREFILLRLTPWIFLRWTWQLDQQSQRVTGSGAPSLRIKLPEMWWDPWFYRLWRPLHAQETVG